MKKFFLILCSVSLAKTTENKNVNIGFLSYLGTTEEKIQNGFDEFRDFSAKLDDKNNKFSRNFINSIAKERRIIKFHDSIMSLLMNLRSQKIAEIMLPEAVGNYILGINIIRGKMKL